MKTLINGSNVSLADIVLTARAAAMKAFAAKDSFGQRSIQIEEFKATGFESADFPTWEQAFNAELEMLTAYSRQNSPSASAAKKAAALATPPAGTKPADK